MKKTAILTTTLFVGLILTSGCASTGYSPPLPIPEGRPGMDSLLSLLDCYPKEFRISQHIIMKAGGKEYDFIGYLAKSGNGDFRALAFGEMGGKIFDFMERNGQREVFSRPEGMPLNPLLDGVMGDISHLYKSDLNGAYMAQNEDNTLSLVVGQQEGRFTEYNFSKGIERMASLEAKEGKVVRRAEYADYRLFSGWERPLPSRIKVVNLRWHYEIRIELLKIDTSPIDERVFDAETGSDK